MYKKKIFSLIALSMLISAQAAAAAGPDAYRADVDRSILPMMEKYRIPGMAVALTVDGRRYFYNYGLAQLAPGKDVTSDTLFELGSVSKAFNVTLAAYAAQRNKLSLADKVSHYLPGLQGTPFGNLTLINLATHTSGGLPLQVPDAVNTEAQLMDYLRAWRPADESGHGRSYSNISIGALGLISARAMGETYVSLLQKVILPELDMRHTWIDVPEHEMQNYAWGYDNQDKPVRVGSDLLGDVAYGIKSTSADMIRFVEANMLKAGEGSPVRQAVTQTHRGYFLTAKYTQDMLWEQYPWPVALNTVIEGNADNMTYNINPVTAITPATPPQQAVLLNKTGATSGFGAYVAFIPEKKIGIVMLANRNYPNVERARAAWQIFDHVTKGSALPD
ncbi:class C beta-lactamase [Acerihabitans arboris]|uniref:Beta-lactamase n=1 Tax=Acerihabitans arboris TaxID=2691583 RepID=A0A845SWT9_9GAMM|nr:class C beta-lactamase [Acerihabitans arboris]NDL65355.1 class C beta-lactamase [Acerihabitans arboris]